LDKQTAVDFSKIIEKYGIALCGTLYPSQIEQLYRAVMIYQRSGRIQKLEDSFANLAFQMIVADLIWQEKQHGRDVT
jgi:hypothetical protein